MASSEIDNVPADDSRIHLGISSCLLGAKVRFNGGHKKDNYVTDVLSNYFDWVRVCPEMDIGMGTPRESVRLVGNPNNPRMLGTKSLRDWTEQMNRYARQKAECLRELNLHGYILKSRSPSCGLMRVKVYSEKGAPVATSPGLFARALEQAMPNLPIEEEGRLNDPRLRENFIVRVFSYYRWTQLRKQPFAMKHLVDFHTRHKFLLMAHNETKMRFLGRFLADAKSVKSEGLLDQYEEIFFPALKIIASTKRHTNVLEHIAGFFKNEISPSDKQELKDSIADYRQSLVPLIVPITLIRHHLKNTQHKYLLNQIYLNPHPKELMLLNHV